MNVTGLVKSPISRCEPSFLELSLLLFLVSRRLVEWLRSSVNSRKRSEAERNESVKRLHASGARHFEKGGSRWSLVVWIFL
jgi:hypothetical protein